MSSEPKDRLILLRLALEGGEAWNNEFKPTLDRSDRDRLKEAGLIEAEQRKNPKSKRRSYHLAMTDRGWGWLSDNLAGTLPSGSKPVQPLQRLLTQLKTYLDRQETSFAEFLAARAAQEESLSDRVKAVYGRLANGRENVRVRLAALRSELADVPRDQLDETLKELAQSGLASLYQLDDPSMIHAEDREAALHIAGGNERHIIYIGGLSS